MEMSTVIIITKPLNILIVEIITHWNLLNYSIITMPPIRYGKAALFISSPVKDGKYYGIVIWTGSRSHISFAYSSIVLSEENLPLYAVLSMAILAHLSLSLYALSTRSCASAYEAKSFKTKYSSALLPQPLRSAS